MKIIAGILLTFILIFVAFCAIGDEPDPWIGDFDKTYGWKETTP